MENYTKSNAHLFEYSSCHHFIMDAFLLKDRNSSIHKVHPSTAERLELHNLHGRCVSTAEQRETASTKSTQAEAEKEKA